MRRPTRRAVTLVELLVVIGVFMIMAAVLAPVVRMTRERAHQADCASNLRRISLALHMYAADHNEAFPERLEELYSQYIEDRKVFGCPAARTRGVTSEPSYVYVAGLTESSPQKEIIARDRDGNHKRGANILRIDGVVEWVEND